MKSRRSKKTEGIEQPNQESIRTLGENVNVKHFGILYADIVKQLEVKEKRINKNIRTRKPLETELCIWNLNKRINTWAVLLVRYLGSLKYGHGRSSVKLTKGQGN